MTCPPPRPRGRQWQSAFTLIEVLLALALTALLLSLLSGGMYVVARDWNQTADTLDDALDDAVVALQIERALLGAFPHSYNNPETLIREIFFEGEADSLRWVSTVSPQRLPGLTAWSLERVAGEGVALSLAPAFTDYPTERLDDAEPRLLFTGYELALKYLHEPDELNREWTDEWFASDYAALPLAVHLLFTPNSSARAEQKPFELIAPLRAWRHRSIMPDTGSAGLGR